MNETIPRRMSKNEILHGLWLENRLRRWMGVKIPPVPLDDLIRQGHLNVRIDSFLGFFAQISWLLPILDCCERRALLPNIELTGPPYHSAKRDSNWLGQHFKIESHKNLIHHTFQNICEIDIQDHVFNSLTIERANYLVKKWLPIRDSYDRQVKDFVSSKFLSPIILGIHYRGTDKVGGISDPGVEAPRVSWEILQSVVDRFIRHNPTCKNMFVASDEEMIKKKLKLTYPHMDVCTFNDTQTSKSGEAIHSDWKNGDNFKKAQEAIINSLILSNCDHVIRTCSFLSAFSVVFNPSISTETLNHPYQGRLWFPDSEVIKRERINNQVNKKYFDSNSF
jgi:hypothetical protein